MSSFVIYADLSRRTLCTADGGIATLPQLTLGDKATFALRLLNQDTSAVYSTDLKVRSLRASIGPVAACPIIGAFSLKFDAGTESVMMPIDLTVDALKAAVLALAESETYPLAEVLTGTQPGVWLLRFNYVGAVPLHVGTSRLFPRAFIRVRAFQTNERWWHEVRLIIAPYAFVNVFYRVLAPPPTVTRIRAGNEGDTDTPAQNEVQKVHIPKTFSGTYYLGFNYRTSRILGTEDGPDEIAATLNAMWSDGATRFVATLPETDEIYVEFLGLLGKAPQELMSVSVNTFHAGDISFDLDLNNSDLAAALRASPSVQVPMEVEVEAVGDDEDPDDPAVPGRIMTLFTAPVTIVREQIWEELAVVPAINWIRPPQPKNYIPYGQNQVITGAQNYVACIGNGTATAIVIDHNLGTEALHITVRENISNGHRIPDNDYEVVFTDTNSLTLIFPTAPAANSLAATISTAGPTSAFVSGLTVTIGQVELLEDRLHNLGLRVGAIEDLLPSVTPARSDSTASSTSVEFEISDLSEMLPGNFGSDFSADAAAKDAKLLPRANGLLPAIHDATVENIATPLPSPALCAGRVYVNSGSTEILVPGGLGRRGSHLEPGGFAGSDGRVWYRLTRDGDTNSFYPTDFEREFFMLPVNDQMLRAGKKFTLSFKLALQTFKATTRAQYILVIEAGSAPGQTSPSPVGENLADVTWRDTPLLSQRIIVTPGKVTGIFGCAIYRDALGSISADQMSYNNWTAAHAGSAPETANFTIRARLKEFDTENSVVGAKGVLYYALTSATAEIA